MHRCLVWIVPAGMLESVGVALGASLAVLYLEMGTAESRQGLCPAARNFRRRFRILILLCWAVPPVFGLGFLVGIVRMFSTEQMLDMLRGWPILSAYIILSLLGAASYFQRFGKPIEDYLQETHEGLAKPQTVVRAANRARRFSLDFWAIFLIYLVLAPAAVMASAAVNTDFVPSPLDWFRIELVSLIVSIIVGLPLFFVALDFFGRTFEGIELLRAHVTVKTKVFLIGALVPLLVDTMLVQYYWTRTGYFSVETFVVWFVLELLAVAGALIFVRSFRQSMAPLQRILLAEEGAGNIEPEALAPMSTDELGLLAAGYRRLLRSMREQNLVLQMRNKALEHGRGDGPKTMYEGILDVTAEAMRCSHVALLLLSEDGESLRFAASRGMARSTKGKSLPLSSKSLASVAYREQHTIVSTDMEHDKNVDSELAKQLGVVVALATPIRSNSRIVGVLVAAFGEPVASPSIGDQTLLESLAQEVGAELLHQELTSQRQHLERSLARSQRLESVGLLAGGVAHDFNNILTVITGASSLAQRTLDKGHPANEDLDLVLEAANRAADLTRQLLAFSKQQVTEAQRLHINERLTNMDTMLRRLLPESIEFVTELTTGLPCLEADPAQIDQIIVNLVVNARDAMAEGGTLRIQTSFEEDPGSQGMVVLKVTDNGTGMTEETMKRAFDPFFTTKKTGKGTGLGLSSVYGAVTGSGGQVRVDSVLDEGTCFTVKLPAVEGTGNARPSAPHKAPRERRGTVLLVEDDKVLRTIVSRALRQDGYKVLVASDGVEALNMAISGDESIDILVSDVVMPKMKGPELAGRLSETHPDIRVLLITGYADEDTMNAVKAGGYRVLAKPFSPVALLDEMSAVLN